MINNLIKIIGAESSLAAPEDARKLCEAISQRGKAAAILYYGSGLWKETGNDTVHDFYVLVDRFTDFDKRFVHAILGNWLPPNVYYMEIQSGQRILRCKFALMRLDQFARAARGQAATPQIWARFAQPCRLLDARDDSVRHTVLQALAQCVMTFHRRALPLVTPEAAPREIWLRGLSATYGAELRSEKPERTSEMFDAMKDSLILRTNEVLPLLKHIPHNSKISTLHLRASRPVLKLFTLIRLMKATVTFDGAADYALWKIERQSGLKIEANDFQRRHPLIGGWPLLWKIYRKGGLR